MTNRMIPFSWGTKASKAKKCRLRDTDIYFTELNIFLNLGRGKFGRGLSLRVRQRRKTKE
jgi:hypothetical protein